MMLKARPAEVVWSAELDAEVLADEGWDALARTGTDDPTSLRPTFVRSVGHRHGGRSRLVQSPFRAGIRLDAYQSCAAQGRSGCPRQPAVADGRRRRARLSKPGWCFVRCCSAPGRLRVVAAAGRHGPPVAGTNWRPKFGLAFTIVDREHLSDIRPGARLRRQPMDGRLLFHCLPLAPRDDTYAAGLRMPCAASGRRPCSILDEAHHAAPASGARYAVDSQFTRPLVTWPPVRATGSSSPPRRITATATPSRRCSRSSPQRFTRGVPVRPRELDAGWSAASCRTSATLASAFRSATSTPSPSIRCRWTRPTSPAATFLRCTARNSDAGPNLCRPARRPRSVLPSLACSSACSLTAGPSRKP